MQRQRRSTWTAIKASKFIYICLCINGPGIFFDFGQIGLFMLVYHWSLIFFPPLSSSKAGWKESHATFMTELRNLQATGLTSIGQSLRNAFDLLNLNRLVTGIDNYGQVCSTHEVEEKSGLRLLRSPHVLPPHPPRSPPPVPSLTSINHPHTVTHTQI